jgi:diguanylate cyclase (GGDEF)-like protein
MTTQTAQARSSPKITPAFLRWSWLNWTMAFAVCLSAALVGIETWQMWRVREASLRSANIVTASLAESLSQQITNTLKTADIVVATLGQRVEADGENPDTLQRLYELMTSLASALPAIHEMGLTDKEGNAIVKSLVPHPVGMNYRERDYFRYLSSHDTRDVFIGQPVKSKVDGSVNITVSRRINAKDGAFAGIVVASVSMNFFRKLFETVQLKSGGFISLVSDDGTLLANSPASRGDGELAALAAAPAGALEYLSPNDGVSRVGAFRHLQHYPMTAMVAQDSSAVLSDWYGQLRVHGAIVLSILMVIGALGYRVDQANRATRVQALCDWLTGLANRRCFNETIKREFQRAARSGRPLSLIMVDLDLFKTFNDQYGHPSGDSCLREVSAVVQDALRRPRDMAARYGGEELAILLPETDIAAAIQIVRDIQAAVRARAIRHEAGPLGVVTLSAGVATWSEGRSITNPAGLVEAADAALYAAKARGRNTFAVHPTFDVATPAAPIEHKSAA